MSVAPLARPPIEEQDGPLPLGDADLNPRDIGFAALIAEDLRTHGGDPLSPGFLALAIHRFGNWRMGVRSKLLRAPLTLAYRVAHEASIALWGIDLPYNSRLGRRLRFGHHGCVFVGAWSIGDDVTIRHSVTIGLNRRGEKLAPIIGNGVEIGPGACVVGGIEIGDGCYIGANTVINEDLAPGTHVLGVPARKIELEKVAAPEPLQAAGGGKRP
jgi:serine O-acetyltransferase